jgi:Ca2+-binding EF-hand superfamily protein
MKKSLILAVTTIAFSSFVSAADDVVVPSAAIDVEANFQAIDTNLDGVISLTEAEGQDTLLAAFPDLDLDKTGDLNEDEFKKFVMVQE